jgi:hypothetical protein
MAARWFPSELLLLLLMGYVACWAGQHLPTRVFFCLQAIGSDPERQVHKQRPAPAAPPIALTPEEAAAERQALEGKHALHSPDASQFIVSHDMLQQVLGVALLPCSNNWP